MWAHSTEIIRRPSRPFRLYAEMMFSIGYSILYGVYIEHMLFFCPRRLKKKHKKTNFLHFSNPPSTFSTPPDLIPTTCSAKIN